MLQRSGNLLVGFRESEGAAYIIGALLQDGLLSLSATGLSTQVVADLGEPFLC